MRNLHTEAELRAAIVELENRRALEEVMLKEQFHSAFDKIGTVGLVGTGIAGFLSKILVQGVLKSPVKKLIGTALLFGVTQVAARNPEVIISLGKRFFNIFRSKSAKRI